MGFGARCAAADDSAFHLVLSGDGDSCLLFDLFIQTLPYRELDQVRLSSFRCTYTRTSSGVHAAEPWLRCMYTSTTSSVHTPEPLSGVSYAPLYCRQCFGFVYGCCWEQQKEVLVD